jgi:hypothetical protein
MAVMSLSRVRFRISAILLLELWANRQLGMLDDKSFHDDFLIELNKQVNRNAKITTH